MKYVFHCKGGGLPFERDLPGDLAARNCALATYTVQTVTVFSTGRVVYRRVEEPKRLEGSLADWLDRQK